MPDLADIPGLDALRARTLGRPDVSIGLLDGRARPDHPCFEGADLNFVEGEWIAGLPAVDFTVQHATGISSILFGQPGTPVEGVAPRCHGLIIATAVDEWTATDDLTIARAIDKAVSGGVSIIHCAFCIPVTTDTVDDLVARSLRNAAAEGILVVAPAGNNRDLCACTPANQADVLAVGSLDDDSTVRDRSSFDPSYVGHSVMAWGDNVLVATPEGGTDRLSGTSCAAPFVTGVAALILSVARDAGLDPDPPSIGRAIIETARPYDPNARDAERAIGGILDPMAALDAVLAAGGARPSLVAPSLRLPSRLFALGQLTIDVADDARRQRLARRMTGSAERIGVVDDPVAVVKHLAQHPEDATLLTWILERDGEPRYALQPLGPAASEVNQRLIAVFQAGAGAANGSTIEQVSVAGIVTNHCHSMYNGQEVLQAIVTLPTNVNAWENNSLAKSAAASVVGPEPSDDYVRCVAEFLAKVYGEHQNDGILGKDRALNYAATNATQAAQAIKAANERSLSLRRIEVVKSRFDRPNSECWDILVYFGEFERPTRPQRLWTWTIDVADVRPVSVGWLRSWTVSGS